MSILLLLIDMKLRLKKGVIHSEKLLFWENNWAENHPDFVTNSCKLILKISTPGLKSLRK